MKVSVAHTTRLEYGDDVVEAVMDVRLGPLSDADQRVDVFDLQVRPHGSVHQYVDGFGNATHLVTVARPHRFVELVAHTEVETFLQDPFALPVQPPPALDAGRRADTLQPSPLVTFSPEVAAMAEPFRSIAEPFEAARELTRHVHEALEYRREVTSVGTTVEEVLRGGAGVCQDFAHLLIALARCLGLPARYASGYIVERAEGSGQPSRGAGASHAWAEVYTPSHGWRGFDPTNNLLANDAYVKVAMGRDYHDVSPTRGTYRGAADERLSVDVQTRVLS